MRFLNKNIWDVEWSGILFYSVEGEFGKDTFKCKVEYIFPMNKGNATYTEFETNEDFVEFLMDNPQYLQYNRGLIHSHNLMSVFFSGTDNSEINENSEFHNYYLSLIVNNKEEMSAKIAFRGKNEETIQRNVSFKGTNGIPQTMKIDSKVEKDVIFHYKCDIVKEDVEVITDNFKKRVEQIIENSKKKELFKQAKVYQAQLFDNKQSLLEQFEKSENLKEIKKSEESSHDDTILEFTATLISLDRLNTKSIEQVLKDLKKKFGVAPTEKNEVELDLYSSTIIENFSDFYHDFYQDSIEECMMDTFEEVCDILEEYSTGNWIADHLYTNLIVHFEEMEQLNDQI